MGYRRIPRIYTLTFEGDLSELVVRAKSIKYGKVRRLIALMDDDSGDDDIMGEIARELSQSIVSWNLLDEDGGEIPVSLEAVDDLEFDEVIAICNKWLDALTGPSQELGKDSPSGESFPGRPLTMEAL